jgi:hypothetical protein
MRHSNTLWLGLLILLLNGCGGGGGGGGLGAVAVLQGRVVLVGTGGPPNPEATVEVGSLRTTTDTQEGTFRLAVPPTATQLTVRAKDMPAFTFALPPLQAGQTYDLGELYIGPQTVVVRGRVVNAITQNPVENAIISLLSRTTRSDSNGRFTLEAVAYDPNGALDPEGTVQRTGYLQRRFLVDQPPDTNGEIELGDIPILPETDENPPHEPGNVYGVVEVPLGLVEGTRIDIFSPPDAQFPIESVIIWRESGEFYLWLLPGNYKLKFTSPGGKRAERVITVTSLTTPLNLGTVRLE